MLNRSRSLYRTTANLRQQQVFTAGLAPRPAAAVFGGRSFHTSPKRAAAASEEGQEQQQQPQEEEIEFPEGDWARQRPSGAKYWFTVLSAYGVLGMTLGFSANWLFLKTMDGRIAPLTTMEDLERLDKEEREKYQAYKMELLEKYAREDRAALEEKLAAKARDRQARRARLKAQNHPIVQNKKE